MLFGSVVINCMEVLIMWEGLVKYLDSVIFFDYKWVINYVF